MAVMSIMSLQRTRTMRHHRSTRTDTIPLKPLLTVQETARILGCSVKSVRRRIEAGDLPAIRDGRLLRVHPDDLDRYIRQHRG